jgi:hypothetical protein
MEKYKILIPTMAAMKNLTQNHLVKDEKEVPDTTFEYNPKKLYIVTLKNCVFACETYSRKQAIEMARNSPELERAIDRECVSNGRPISMYAIPDISVIQVKPWHRFGSWERGMGKNIDLYVYFSPGSKRPMVFRGESSILDYASSGGVIKKVRVHSDYDSKEQCDTFEEQYACSPKIPITYPIGMCDPYEIV